jgi:hypothetical protein
MDVSLGSGGDRDGDDQGGDLLPAFGQEPVERIGDRAEKEVVHGGGVLVGEIEDGAQVGSDDEKLAAWSGRPVH